MENKVDIDTIVEKVENYSKLFKEDIDDMNLRLGEIESKLQYFSNYLEDMANDALTELHSRYGIEESQENYDKVKAGIADSIKYNVNYFTEIFNRMVEEL